MQGPRTPDIWPAPEASPAPAPSPSRPSRAPNASFGPPGPEPAAPDPPPTPPTQGGMAAQYGRPAGGPTPVVKTGNDAPGAVEAAPAADAAPGADAPPLAGILVLEVGNYMAGPFCTMQLA